jgi:hypothetical protein
MRSPAPTVAEVTASPSQVTDSRPSAPLAIPAVLDVRAEFGKVLAGQQADFKVQAVPAQRSLRIARDQLAFTVHSARDGFVQVLVREADGSLLLLFPNAQSSDNAIRAGQTLTLPQSNWMLDTVEPAGRADFLVVVSAQPRDYSGLSQERDYIFLKLPTGQKGGELAAAWTRSTPLMLGGLKACPSADCDAYGAALFSIDIQH